MKYKIPLTGRKVSGVGVYIYDTKEQAEVPVGCSCEKSKSRKLVGVAKGDGTKWYVYRCNECGLLFR